MEHEVRRTEQVEELIAQLARTNQKRHRKVIKALGLLEHDPAYPSLQTHRFESLDSVFGEAIWESYVENNTPGAWRMWWFYGPGQRQITVVLIAAHP
jgi:hypothetical protein